MSSSDSPGTASFFLETDDRTDEERTKKKPVKKDRLVSALNMGSREGPKAPMDSLEYQDEIEPTTPKIKFNLNFDKKIKGVPMTKEETAGRFDIKRLFDAVSTGDVMKLDGLHKYLHQSMKKLTNSEYQSYGKTPLLKGLLNLRDGRNKTVEYLLDISERMGDIKEFVNAAYRDSYYKGQAALHIAIERRSLHYVQLLVKKGSDVHAKACGKFFQPQDGPSFYFGELPLSLAACTNQPEVVDFLLENEYQSVDVREKDSHGNTVLHALVVVADNTGKNTEFIIYMYDHILTSTARLHPNWRLEDIENNQGLTPVKLAAKTGKIGLFKHMLQREFQDRQTRHLSRKFTEWVYGPVQSSLYDLASLDSYENNSVLEIIVYGSEIPNRHEMLQIEPLNRLLEEKWKRFAGRIFLLNFIIYVFYLSTFTAVGYNRREGKPPFSIDKSPEGYLRLSGKLLILLASVYFFIGGLLDMKRKQPKLKTLLIDGFSEILFFLQASLFLASTALYCSGREEYLGFLVLCLALSWLNLLYFSRGNRHMGIYSIMIQKMIISDILRFLFVYVVFLFGFSAAVVTLLLEPPVNNSSATDDRNTTGKGRRAGEGFYATLAPSEAGGCQKPTYKNFTYTTLELFKFTIGMGDLEFTEQYQYKEVFYILLISYIVLTYILLLNMLIALMSRTVERISIDSTSVWKLQRAITILDLERKVPFCLRRRLRSGVEMDLGTNGEEDRRRCFRVEEVNWNKWNTNLGIINEDPGSRDTVPMPALNRSPARGRSLRGFLRDFSQRRTPSRHRQYNQESREMSPLSTSPV